METFPVQETTTAAIDVSSLSSPVSVPPQPTVTPTQQPNSQPTSTKYLGYRQLVSCISDQLRKENALRLAYMYELPAWYYEVGPTYDTAFTLRVLIALEGKGVYSPENLHGLKNALKAIEREDCARRVDEYLRSLTERTRRPVVHSSSMIISGDDVERDLLEPILQHSRSIPNDIHKPIPKEEGVSYLDSTSNSQTNEAESPLGKRDSLLHRSVSHLDVRLAIECVIATAESLMSQISKISHQTRHSSPCRSSGTHTPPVSKSPHVPIYLQQAISGAKQVAANLNQVLHSNGTSSPYTQAFHSAPVTPARSSPVPEFDRVPSLSDSRKLSRSGSSGLRRVSKTSSVSSGVTSPLGTEHRLQQANRELSFTERKEDVTPTPKGCSADLVKDTGRDGLSAPQPERMHGPLPSHVTSPTHSHVAVRRTRSRREVKQFSRKGLLFWQIKVKRLRLWLTQPSSKIESEQFYDHNRRSFKAVLFPHGLGDDEGNHMTLTIDCLDEPRNKGSVPRSNIVVKLLDPQCTDNNIPTVARLIERRGIRFIQQFISHEHVQKLSSTGIIIITIAVVSEQAEETDDDLL